MSKDSAKIIKTEVYSPKQWGSKSGKAKIINYICTKSETCSLLKNGLCVNASQFSSKKCPNGWRTREEGFTPRSKKYQTWIDEQKTIHMETLNVSLDIPPTKFAVIDEYIYIPYSYWNQNRNLIDIDSPTLFTNGTYFIEKSRFTLKFFELMISYQPNKFDSRAAHNEYQSKVVPLMVQHLSEVFPKMYAEWVNEYPISAERLIPLEIDYVGRTAVLNTVSIGSEFSFDTSENLLTWNGSHLVSDNYRVSFPPTKTGNAKIEFEITDSDTVKITNNDQVIAGQTIFID